MKHKPRLDNRTKDDIRGELAAHAAEYLPEWRLEPSQDDPGAAIAEIFTEMFKGSVDRFNQIPNKYYTEFLNLVGVNLPDNDPASGYVRFTPSINADEPILVPKDTQVFAPTSEQPADDGEVVEDMAADQDIIFSTSQTIQATPSRLEAIFYSDSESSEIYELSPDIIIKNELSSGTVQPFFGSKGIGGENLCRHDLILVQDSVFSVSGAVRFEIELVSGDLLGEAQLAALLASDKAVWTILTENGIEKLISGETHDNVITLEKRSSHQVIREDDGYCLHCELSEQIRGELSLLEIYVSAMPLSRVEIDSLSYNDVPIDVTEGGYCFGRRPTENETLYIKCDTVFSKCGALVNAAMDISTIVYKDYDENEPLYQFNKRIIDKSDAKIIEPDKVYVDSVVWEYFNGRGFARLDVKGDVNPFSGNETVERGELKRLTFTVPDDIKPVLINAEEGYYIRARVTNVANFLSLRGKWLLPYIKSVSLGYQYGSRQPISIIKTFNNGESRMLHLTSGQKERFVFFRPLTDERAMYFCFDRDFSAIPLSIYFGVAQNGSLREKLFFELYTSNGFVSVKSVDRTDALSMSGTITLYVTDQPAKTLLFGREGYYLRIISKRNKSEIIPIIGQVALNVVECRQVLRCDRIWADTGVYDASKVVRLLQTPVVDLSVFVNEKGRISSDDLERLRAECPDELDESGGELYVRWHEVDSFVGFGANDRVYTLEAMSGELRFGDGIRGAVLPSGERTVRVDYTAGGGARGNIPTGSIKGLVGSIPKIVDVSNITPMSGGTDPKQGEFVERVGSRSLRSLGRALTSRDYETLTLEHFGAVRGVRCFASTGADGEYAAGQICVAVMCQKNDSEMRRNRLCGEIYQYLAERAEATLVAAGALHVVPTIETTINVEATIELSDLDQAVATAKEITDLFSDHIDTVWRTRPIGSQVRIHELYELLASVPNVRRAVRVTVGAEYTEHGVRRTRPLDSDTTLRLAVVKSGRHIIKFS